MNSFIIYSILCYGITNILVFGSIFKFFRDYMEKISPNFFGVLFNCPMCTGFYVGVILNLLGYSVISKFMPEFTIVLNLLKTYTYLDITKYVLEGSISSGVVWLIHNFEEALERHGTAN